MTGMEDALAAHIPQGYGYDGNVACRCGAWDSMTDDDAEYAAHVALALTAAGYGSQHDAWADGAEELTEHWISTQYALNSNGPTDPPVNPYPPTEGATK